MVLSSVGKKKTKGKSPAVCCEANWKEFESVAALAMLGVDTDRRSTRSKLKSRAIRKKRRKVAFLGCIWYRALISIDKVGLLVLK